MKKRLFIGLTLPEDIKRRLKRETDKIWPQVYGVRRIVDPSLWHITILFLGYQEDEFLPAIIAALQKAAETFSPPLIEFSKIATYPVKNPRVLAIETETKTAQVLAPIKKLLEEEVLAASLPLAPDIHQLRPHVTLARLTEAAHITPVPFVASFEAETLELFESALTEDNQPEYFSLQRFAFGEKEL